MTKKELKTIYGTISSFQEGRAWVKLNRKYGHIDNDGKITTPIIYDKYEYSRGFSSFQEGRAWVKLNGKYGHVDLNGKVITLIIYDMVENFIDGCAYVMLKDKNGNPKWGVVDLNGNVMIPPIMFDCVSIIEKGIIEVRIGSAIGRVDLEGNILQEDQKSFIKQIFCM